MMRESVRGLALLGAGVTAAVALTACSGDGRSSSLYVEQSGGAGGGEAGGATTGGVESVVGTGGSLATGGIGGMSTGGAGGTAGGGHDGGVSGASDAAGAGGGAGQGGSAGMKPSGSGGAAAMPPSYFVGADITFVQADEAAGATFVDGDPKDILEILKSHGFNYIRLRTFVDPRASDGYDKQNGNADLAHTITFGKRIKAAGMGFLLDFHYSDNWADPGKQCVPVAWQTLTSIDDLARAVHDYTKDAVSQLVAAGARPDMVQIGNEITPGMLMHVCDGMGQPTGNARVSGSAANFANLGALLRAGVSGVKEVDPAILTMLHIDRGNVFDTSRDYIDKALAEHVAFDVFGESCYQAYQGNPNDAQATENGWNTTFSRLAARYPTLKFVAAEYGPLQREINDVVFGLPNLQGAGTFNWEPTHQGDWNTGHALFTASGNRYTTTADLRLYDAMKTTYSSRL